MALDIFISDSHDTPEKLLSLYIEDYDLIMEKIDHLSNFSLIKKNLSDYYGENQVYLNELHSLRAEVKDIKKLFQFSSSQTALQFLYRLSDLIDYAIEHKRTIRFVGD